MTSFRNVSRSALEYAFPFERLLQRSARNRVVSPPGQPFAFATHAGKVRKNNQDTAAVITGVRANYGKPYLVAVVCDGMGGLERGDEAAMWAAASFLSVMVDSSGFEQPSERMNAAIEVANAAVYDRFQGKSGAVLAALLLEAEQTTIGWVGDARVYGWSGGGSILRLLTRDDTVANVIAEIEGAAPDAMDALLSAIGTKDSVQPHVLSVNEHFRRLALFTDGVHRMNPGALLWIFQHALTPADVVQRAVAAANWEGGHDNATALVLELPPTIPTEFQDEHFAIWNDNMPQVWRILRKISPALPAASPAGAPSSESRAAPRHSTKRGKKSRNRRPTQSTLSAGDAVLNAPAPAERHVDTENHIKSAEAASSVEGNLRIHDNRGRLAEINEPHELKPRTSERQPPLIVEQGNTSKDGR